MDIRKALRRRQRVTGETNAQINERQMNLEAARKKELESIQLARKSREQIIKDNTEDVQLVREESSTIHHYEGEFKIIGAHIKEYARHEDEDLGDVITGTITKLHNKFENFFLGTVRNIVENATNAIKAAKNLEFIEDIKNFSQIPEIKKDKQYTILIEGEEEQIIKQAQILTKAFNRLGVITAELNANADKAFGNEEKEFIPPVLAAPQIINNQIKLIKEELQKLYVQVKEVWQRAKAIKVDKDLEDAWQVQLRKLSAGDK